MGVGLNMQAMHTGWQVATVGAALGMLIPQEAYAQSAAGPVSASPAQTDNSPTLPSALSESFQPPFRPFAPQKVPFNLVLYGGAPLARIAKNTGVTQLRFRPLSLIAMMNPDLDWRWSIPSWFLTFTFETYADLNQRATWLQNPSVDRTLQRWPFSRLHTLIETIKPGDHRLHSYIWGAPDDARLPLRHAPYVRYHYAEDATTTSVPARVEKGVKKGIRAGTYQLYGEYVYEAGEWRLDQVKMQKTTASASVGDSLSKQRRLRPDLFTRAIGVEASEFFTWRYLTRNFLLTLFGMKPSDAGQPKLSKDQAHALLIAESDDFAFVERLHGEVADKLEAAKQAGHASDIAFYQERLSIYTRAREQIRGHLATLIQFSDPNGTMRRFAKQTRRLIYQVGLEDMEEGSRHAARTATEMFQVANFFNIVFDLSALRKDPNQSLFHHVHEAFSESNEGLAASDRIEWRRRFLRDQEIANRLLDAASPFVIGFISALLADVTAVWSRKHFEKQLLDKNFWFEGVVHIWALWAATYWCNLSIDTLFKRLYPDVMYKLLTLDGQLSIGPIAMALYAAMAFEAAFFGVRGLLSAPNIFFHFNRHKLPAGVIAVLSVAYMVWGLY